jgi:hypothetical protein
MITLSYPYIASIYAPDDGKRGWYDVMCWCEEKVGSSQYHYDGEGVFKFRKECDYMMFLLRWS